MAEKLLSKSKYMNGRQCLKYLWTAVHDPDKIAQPDVGTQQRFDAGYAIGELAKSLFPNGINIPTNGGFMEGISQTEQLLLKRVPLFEAAILTGRLYARVDILKPANSSEWDIIEVKSAASVKPEHIQDVAFQRFCLQRAGLAVNRCFLMCVNTQYVKEGDLDPAALFLTQDITESVMAESQGLAARVEGMLEIMDTQRSPDVPIGSQCNNPYSCPVQDYCWAFLPERHVFTLYSDSAREKASDLLSHGILAVADIPESYPLTEKQQIQREAIIADQPYLYKHGINSFLSTLHYPLHFLDFETFDTAIPLFNGTRPYQRIPFQFSLHIQKHTPSDPKHFSFLAEGTEDPRPAFLVELRKMLGSKGSIIVYNQSFEEGVLREMALAFPEYDEWVNNTCSRMVDLWRPFKNFYYYHPAQDGSGSLKSVLPALTGMGYSDLHISEGQMASVEYFRVTYGNASEEDRQSVKENLLKYCGRDTEGMVWIIEKLRALM
ncbi:MAG TPA: DUF2779 domain-containing protein [Dehalococcoidia bacterium]|nr:DUF2779 domain-containing protein [Dehalococcoidia bacterium]